MIEMIQTEGSDAEMVEDFDSDTDFEPDRLLVEEIGSEVDSDPAATPPRGNVLVETPVHHPSPPPPPVHVNNDEAFGNDVGESEDDFSFFPCVPPYVDENAGLHLSDAVTGHECTWIKIHMNLFLDMIRASNEVCRIGSTYQWLWRTFFFNWLNLMWIFIGLLCCEFVDFMCITS